MADQPVLVFFIYFRTSNRKRMINLTSLHDIGRHMLVKGECIYKRESCRFLELVLPPYY